MKKLLFIFALTSLFAFDVYAQSPKWMISSGFSPISRSAENRVLENPTNTKAWEWMNRGGWMLNDGISVGVTGTVRYQTNKQMTTYEGDLITSTYERKIIDNLFGVGPFVTKFFTLSSRFSLQTTFFGLAEFGKGTFKTVKVESRCNYNCVYFVDPNVFLPLEVDRRTYKERNFYAGLEVGASYFVKDWLAIQGNLTLLQYTNYDAEIGDTDRLELPIPMDIYSAQSGSDFIFFTDRPVFHLGVMLLLN